MVSEDVDEMKQFYEDELRKRDKLVDLLRRENLEILENALKQTEENLKLREEIDNLKNQPR